VLGYVVTEVGGFELSHYLCSWSRAALWSVHRITWPAPRRHYVARLVSDAGLGLASRDPLCVLRWERVSNMN
jgi:hypothetical protein